MIAHDFRVAARHSMADTKTAGVNPDSYVDRIHRSSSSLGRAATLSSASQRSVDQNSHTRPTRTGSNWIGVSSRAGGALLGSQSPKLITLPQIRSRGSTPISSSRTKRSISATSREVISVRSADTCSAVIAFPSTIHCVRSPRLGIASRARSAARDLWRKRRGSSIAHPTRGRYGPVPRNAAISKNFCQARCGIGGATRDRSRLIRSPTKLARADQIAVPTPSRATRRSPQRPPRHRQGTARA